MARVLCHQIARNLHRILEEDPEDKLCEKIKTHLDQCPSCAAHYKELENLVALCQRFPTERIPEEQKRLMLVKLRGILSGQ